MGGMKFTKEHEWVKIEGGTAIVGITDYAQKALGEIVSVDLPKQGTRFEQHKSFAMVDSMKASSDVYAPISGEITEVNTVLNDNPQWINESPYENGWLVRMKPDSLSELDSLMNEDEYKKYISGLGEHH